MTLAAQPAPAPKSQAPETDGARAAVLAVLALAIAYRIYLLFTQDFPINDGALFTDFVKAVAVTFPAIPDQVAFNGLQIPFAYPPLSFWLAAAVTKTGADAIAVLHASALLLNIGYLILFTLLLNRLGYSSLLIALALAFFCTNLRSFEWLIMGAGFTRGLGAFFMLLALYFLAKPAIAQPEHRSLAPFLLAGASVGAAVLSHPQWGILAAALSLAMVAVRAGSLKNFVGRSMIVGVTALVVAGPWIAYILQVHGPEPFAAAAATSQHDLLVTTAVNFAKAVLINPFIALGAWGFLRRKDYFWFAALAFAVVLVPRLATQAWALPIALFAAEGVIMAVALLRRLVPSRTLAVASVALVAVAVVGFRIERDVRLSGPYFQPLKPELRAAMAWVAQNRPNTRFAVVTDAPWYYDASAEWFPPFANAVSTTTVQGREWLPNREFSIWEERAGAMKESKSCDVLMKHLREFGPAQYHWVETRRECFASGGQRPIFDNGAVAIYPAGR